MPRTCGSPSLIHVGNAAEKDLGVLEASNDSSHLYLSYAPASGCTIRAVAAYVGEWSDLPLDEQKHANWAAFPIAYGGLLETRMRTARIERSLLTDCPSIVMRIALERDGQSLIAWAGSSMPESDVIGFRHCLQSCSQAELKCDLADEKVLPLTLTQEDWATEVGKPYVHQLNVQFGALFPEGLTLGCERGNVRLQSAGQVLQRLPTDRPAGPLEITKDMLAYEDNRLASELLSLLLVLEMDAQLADFSPGSESLAHLQVAEGAFEGWSVKEIVLEANQVLGRCTSNYTPDQIYDVVRAINLTFAPNTTQHSFLKCPNS
jgi:hypothetical protein